MKFLKKHLFKLLSAISGLSLSAGIIFGVPPVYAFMLGLFATATLAATTFGLAGIFVGAGLLIGVLGYFVGKFFSQKLKRSSSPVHLTAIKANSNQRRTSATDPTNAGTATDVHTNGKQPGVQNTDGNPAPSPTAAGARRTTVTKATKAMLISAQTHYLPVDSNKDRDTSCEAPAITSIVEVDNNPNAAVALTEFHFFFELPSELQIRILQLSILSNPETLYQLHFVNKEMNNIAKDRWLVKTYRVGTYSKKLLHFVSRAKEALAKTLLKEIASTHPELLSDVLEFQNKVMLPSGRPQDDFRGTPLQFATHYEDIKMVLMLCGMKCLKDDELENGERDMVIVEDPEAQHYALSSEKAKRQIDEWVARPHPELRFNVDEFFDSLQRKYLQIDNIELLRTQLKNHVERNINDAIFDCQPIIIAYDYIRGNIKSFTSTEERSEFCVKIIGGLQCLLPVACHEDIYFYLDQGENNHLGLKGKREMLKFFNSITDSYDLFFTNGFTAVERGQIGNEGYLVRGPWEPQLRTLLRISSGNEIKYWDARLDRSALAYRSKVKTTQFIRFYAKLDKSLKNGTAPPGSNVTQPRL